MTASVPVAVFAFRRAPILARTLAALRTNGVSCIYAFSDGPRNVADEPDVAEVRRVLRAVDWAEMHLVERPQNAGLNTSLIGGISDVLAMHEDVVVCEEDIEFTPGVYDYMVAGLTRYRNEPRAMSIGGWTHPRMTPTDAHDAPYFSGRFTEWGWATWRRAWAGFQGQSAAQLRDRCIARGIDLTKYGRDIEDWFGAGAERVAWDYCFMLHSWLHDGLHLLPAKAMTMHIGDDERSSHPQDRTDWNDRAESPPRPAEVQWPEVRENAESAGLWRRALEPPPRPSLATRIRRRLARMLGR